MRNIVAMLLITAFIFAAGCTSDSASNKGSNGLLCLKVDFAAPSGKDDLTPIPATVKPGWTPWVINDWDFYRTNLNWEDSSAKFPKDGPGIAGSGVHAGISCHYEGIMAMYVAGMRRFLAGGLQPQKQPLFDPICNSWVAGSDFPDNPTSDLIMPLYNLPAGKYRLVSYHNSFNGKRIGDEPTGIEYQDVKTPEPPMKSIKVYSLKTIVSDYYQPNEDSLIKGKTYGTSMRKVIVPGVENTDNVKQTLHAADITIQQVKSDAELKPSIIEFTTDGSPVFVVYAGGCCKSDDLRRHRNGGYSILNAFELIQLSENF